MKKLYVFMTALLTLFAINANADRILYSENYEAGGVPATWTINGNASKTYAKIVGDEEGKYLSFYNGDNGRSAHCLWGEGIFDGVDGLAEYSVKVQFQFQAFGTNQYNGEFAVFTGAGCASTNGQGNSLAGDNNKAWSNYSVLTPNCLFGLAQNSAAKTIKNGVVTNAPSDEDHTHWFINNDTTNVFTPTAGTWYELILTVNTATREVTYNLEDFDGTVKKTGTKTLSEEASVFASGIFLMNARYQSVTNVDNIVVSVPGDFANVPVIALTGLNKAERTYTISFMEGETLHVTNTDGSQKTASYDDCEGKYVISTTTSGTISAYTTLGSNTSETATMEVVCEPIVLPSPTYSIISADEGYAKTYSFTVDNSAVEMQPVIYIDIKFEGEDGTVLESKNNEKVATFVVPTKGKLTITTKDLYGYYDNGSLTVQNDIEYEIKNDIDLQHIAAEELTEKGFNKIDDLNTVSMSGETAWTGRMRMYFEIATGEKNEENKDITKLYPAYGFTEAAENYQATVEGYKKDNGWTLDGRTYADLTTAEPIQRYLLEPSNLTEEKAHSLFAPLYTWNTASDGSDVAGIKFNMGIGLINVGNIGDGQTGNMVNNHTMGVDGLTDDDLIVVSKINNYGGGSIHPTFPAGTTPEAAKAEYKAMHLGGISEVYKGTETFQLYRIDTALNRVLVLSQKNGTGIDELNYNKVVSDHNAPVYNLNGVQVNPNALTKGIYVKQGKKFVVK